MVSAEWLSCVAETVDDVQDPFWVASCILASYAPGFQSGRGVAMKFANVRPVVQPCPFATSKVPKG